MALSVRLWVLCSAASAEERRQGLRGVLQEPSPADCFAQVNRIPCSGVLWTDASAKRAMSPLAGDSFDA